MSRQGTRPVRTPQEPLGPGVFVAIMGPSGAGKDTLLAHAAGQLRDARTGAVHFVRRVITREADSFSEEHDTLTPSEFERVEAEGGFALSWRAHGLSYGLPASIDRHILRGSTVVANVSRAVLPQLGARYAYPLSILVTASPDVLARRLARRGRETEAEIRARLVRQPVADAQASVTILNDRAPEMAGEELVALIRTARARFGGPMA